MNTYHIVARVQKQVKQSAITSVYEMKLHASSINDAMQQFKTKAVQAGWQHIWISTVMAMDAEPVD